MNKIVKYLLIAMVAFMLLLGTFSGGVLVGHFVTASAVANLNLPGASVPPALSTPPGASQSTPADVQHLFQPFWEAWTLIHQEYVDQPVDDTKLMQGAIQGMLASLGDPHTIYLTPQEYKDANSSLTGSYEGIGAYVDTTGSYLKIMSVISGSPAEKANLKSGDEIIAIDGTSMTGISPEVVRQKVLGPAGSSVTLTIQRSGVDKPFDVKIVRAKITVASVQSKMLDGNIAYVQLTTFGDTTSDSLKNQLGQLMAQHPKGLILDLRNNGGGYLQTAIDVASQFLDKGTVVYEKHGDGTMDTYNVTPGGLATNIPMVVLVNEGTASASEIVSGALQDYGRARLVGVTTYGKGTVQIWTPLSNNEGAVSITIARWLTPKKRTIDQKGLTPDVVVQITQDDINANRDPQLDKAIQLLSSNGQ